MNKIFFFFTVIVCWCFVVQCNLKRTCDIDLDLLTIRSCNSPTLRIDVEKKNGDAVLVNFINSGKIIRQDTIIHIEQEYYFLDKSIIVNRNDSLFTIFTKLEDKVYGLVYIRDEISNNVLLVCKLEDFNESKFKVRFANRNGQSNKFSVASINNSSKLILDDIYDKEYINVEYFYAPGLLNYRIIEDNITWSAPTDWMNTTSLTQSIYLDHIKTFSQFIRIIR